MVPKIWRLIGLFALLMFTGDLVADSLCDVCGRCSSSETSSQGPAHNQGGCAQCSCALQIGAVIVCDTSVVPIFSGVESLNISSLDEKVPLSEPASIKHPPRFA
jgi:hypothetical protein